jgi:hypothetical protein
MTCVNCNQTILNLKTLYWQPGICGHWFMVCPHCPLTVPCPVCAGKPLVQLDQPTDADTPTIVQET